MPLISIIIPMYNVEKYIERCLNSVANQTFSDIEVIVVNDGSADESAAIAKKYETKDSRFKLFTKENGGISSARNYGIERAVGKYILFLDSDDMIHPQLCEVMAFVAESKKAEVVKCRYISFNSDQEISCIENYRITEIPVTKISNHNLEERIINDEIVWSVWGGVYSRELLTRLKLHFELGKELGEDVPFTLKLLDGIENFYYLNEAMYFYYQNSASIMHSIGNKLFADYNHIFDIMKNYFGNRTNMLGALTATMWGYCVAWNRTPRESYFSFNYEIIEVKKIESYLTKVSSLPAYDYALRTVRDVNYHKDVPKLKIWCLKAFSSLYSNKRIHLASWLWHIYSCSICKLVGHRGR